MGAGSMIVFPTEPCVVRTFGHEESLRAMLTTDKMTEDAVMRAARIQCRGAVQNRSFSAKCTLHHIASREYFVKFRL